MENKKNIYRFLSLALGAITLLLSHLAKGAPEIVENYYSRSFFLAVRTLFDGVLGWLPFPAIYLFFPLVLWYVFSCQWKIWRKRSIVNNKFVNSLFSLSSILAFLLFLFQFLWGFNYSRIPVNQQLGLDIKPLTVDEIWTELEQETQRIIALRQQIPNASDEALPASIFDDNLEETLRLTLKQTLSTYNYPADANVRAHLIYPKGIFMRFSTSGLYLPFTGQGQVDAGQTHLNRPFTLTHEMAHGYGFGHEGICNFWAYVACRNAADPAIAYTGTLSYWRTLAVNYLSYYPEKYSEFRATLPLGIQADLDAINTNLRAYPDIMPDVRNLLYDQYLKSQGLDDGIANYNQVLMFVKAWKERYQ